MLAAHQEFLSLLKDERQAPLSASAGARARVARANERNNPKSDEAPARAVDGDRATRGASGDERSNSSRSTRARLGGMAGNRRYSSRSGGRRRRQDASASPPDEVLRARPLGVGDGDGSPCNVANAARPQASLEIAQRGERRRRLPTEPARFAAGTG